MGLELGKLTKLLDCLSAVSLGESREKGSEIGAVMVDGNLTEQQQAEERLYRDYIHRLVKVPADFLMSNMIKASFWYVTYFASKPSPTRLKVVGCSLKSPDCCVNTLKSHSSDSVYVLSSQQSPEYPNFQYLCKLCSVHIENIQGAHKHIKEKRHKKNIMVRVRHNV